MDGEYKKTGILKSTRNSIKRKVQNFSHESDDAVIEPLLKDKTKSEIAKCAKSIIPKMKTDHCIEMKKDDNKYNQEDTNKIKIESQLESQGIKICQEKPFIKIIDDVTSKVKSAISNHTVTSSTLNSTTINNKYSSPDYISNTNTEIKYEVNAPLIKYFKYPKTDSTIRGCVDYDPSPLIFTTAKIHSDVHVKSTEPVNLNVLPILSTSENNEINNVIKIPIVPSISNETEPSCAILDALDDFERRQTLLKKKLSDTGAPVTNVRQEIIAPNVNNHISLNKNSNECAIDDILRNEGGLDDMPFATLDVLDLNKIAIDPFIELTCRTSNLSDIKSIHKPIALQEMNTKTHVSDILSPVKDSIVKIDSKDLEDFVKHDLRDTKHDTNSKTHEINKSMDANDSKQKINNEMHIVHKSSKLPKNIGIQKHKELQQVTSTVTTTDKLSTIGQLSKKLEHDALKTSDFKMSQKDNNLENNSTPLVDDVQKQRKTEHSSSNTIDESKINKNKSKTKSTTIKGTPISKADVINESQSQSKVDSKSNIKNKNIIKNETSLIKPTSSIDKNSKGISSKLEKNKQIVRQKNTIEDKTELMDNKNVSTQISTPSQINVKSNVSLTKKLTNETKSVQGSSDIKNKNPNKQSNTST